MLFHFEIPLTELTTAEWGFCVYGDAVGESWSCENTIFMTFVLHLIEDTDASFRAFFFTGCAVYPSPEGSKSSQSAVCCQCLTFARWNVHLHYTLWMRYLLGRWCGVCIDFKASVASYHYWTAFSCSLLICYSPGHILSMYLNETVSCWSGLSSRKYQYKCFHYIYCLSICLEVVSVGGRLSCDQFGRSLHR